jgi:hypothetical protein
MKIYMVGQVLVVAEFGGATSPFSVDDLLQIWAPSLSIIEGDLLLSLGSDLLRFSGVYY